MAGYLGSDIFREILKEQASTEAAAKDRASWCPHDGPHPTQPWMYYETC